MEDSTLKKILKKEAPSKEKIEITRLCSAILTTLTTNRTLREVELNERTYIIYDYY